VKIAFLDVVHPCLMKGLQIQGHECLDLTKESIDNIEIAIEDVHGIIIRSRIPLTEDILSKIQDLKFIARSGSGMENIDLTHCKKNNIALFSAAEGNRNAVAEHALGMILTVFNQINTADAEIRKGIWEREKNRGVELDGKVVGIIGFGNNGSAFAQKLKGFKVEILAYDKYRKGFGTADVCECDLEEIFKRADVVSLHIPQNNETQWMVDANFISQMKKSFYLINISRGKLVRTEDLMNALDKKKVLGACLDVLEFEKSSFEDLFSDKKRPASLSRLLSSKKVVFTPHVAGWTEESYESLSQVLLDKINEKFGKA
jgi:D-3-phosphoglycerate dehydrogenase / 2-oxoglutarate reductase